MDASTTQTEKGIGPAASPFVRFAAPVLSSPLTPFRQRQRGDREGAPLTERESGQKSRLHPLIHFVEPSLELGDGI